MNTPKLLLALLPVFLTAPAFAQTNGGTGRGLDHLDEATVMERLATDNLTTLLKRDFEVYKVPAVQQDQMATLPLLHQLMNPIGLSVAKRHELAVRVANGLDALLPKQTDAKSLLALTNDLYGAGVLPTQAEMEFFGENPTNQSQLKPVVDTSKKMFQKVEVLAGAELDKVANKIKNPAMFNAAQPQMIQLRSMKFEAEYTDNMAAYSQCLSIPQGPGRKTIADPAITFLSDYDNPQSGVQSMVRLQIGKLQLAEGDYDKAKATLDTIVNNPGNAIVPPPPLPDQNNARYFAVVSEIVSRKLPAAEEDIEPYAKWQQQNFMPALTPAEQNEVKASLSMLKFRLYTAQADLAAAPAVQEAANNKAIDELAELLKQQPGLKDLIYDQLVARIPANANLATLNPLILQGLRQQGFDELKKPADEKVDTKKLQHSIEAAAEIIQRKGQPGIDAADVDKSAYFLGYAYERLEEAKQAAGAFLDYAEKFNANKDWGVDALDHATKWIGVLRKKDAEDADTRALYDRFLPVAINAPYNRKQFAFQYAKLLKEEHKYTEAINYFKMIPAGDKQYPDAQLQEMLALSLMLHDAPADQHKDIVNQILDITRIIEGLLTNATSDADKKTYVEWVRVADENAAELTRTELKDPAASLKFLEGFEDRVAACKDPTLAHIVALKVRIPDYLDLRDIASATKSLLTLLNADEVAGQSLMFEVLQAVSRDMDAAKQAKDIDLETKLAQDKAELSGFVVDWATKSQDPKVTAQLAVYQRFDADAKKDAAELIKDDAERRKKLTDALHAYQALLTSKDEQLQLAAQQGIGLTQSDLGVYDEAIKFLAPLVNGKKFGGPTLMVGPAGAQHEEENPQYWQGNYELIKSMVELAKQNPKDPKSQDNLKQADSYIRALYVIHGKKTGGTTYHDDFENLKAELAKLVPPSAAGRAPVTAAPPLTPAK